MNKANLKRLSGKNFIVAQAIVGDEGTLIFGDCGIGDIFFAPKGDAANFYQLHRLIESSSPSFRRAGAERKFSVATDDEGGSFHIFVKYGKSALLVWESETSVYSCLSAEETQAVEGKIRSGEVALLSLPTDKRTAYAVELPQAIEGKEGYLVVTSPKYNFSYDFDAYIVPYDKTLPVTKVDVGKVTRYRDGGTTLMTIGKTHNFHAASPFDGGEISIDKEEARKLSEAEVKELVNGGRVPGVPKKPTSLVTPYTRMDVCPARRKNRRQTWLRLMRVYRLGDQTG